MYETACQLICAVSDRDSGAVNATMRSLGRADLQNLAVMLAAMVPEESHTPANVIRARTRYIECTVPNQPDVLAFEHAADTVSSLFNVPLPDLFSTSRKQQVTQARLVLCWIASHVLGMNYSEIGRRLSRDHTTVIAACARVSKVPALRAKAAIVAGALGDAA